MEESPHKRPSPNRDIDKPMDWESLVDLSLESYAVPYKGTELDAPEWNKMSSVEFLALAIDRLISTCEIVDAVVLLLEPRPLEANSELVVKASNSSDCIGSKVAVDEAQTQCIRHREIIVEETRLMFPVSLLGNTGLLQVGVSGVVSDQDLKYISKYARLVEVATRNTQLCQREMRLRIHHDAVLEFIRATSTDGVTLEEVVNQAVSSLVRILHCDLISLYVVDEAKNELWTCRSTQLDVGYRIPRDRGIIGQCSTERKVVNIEDAHLDERFNAHIDKLTGYRTRSVLCVPVLDGHGACIAVIQAVNKTCEVCEKTLCTTHKVTFQPDDVEVATEFAAGISQFLKKVVRGGADPLDYGDGLNSEPYEFMPHFARSKSALYTASMIPVQFPTVDVTLTRSLSEWGLDYYDYSEEQCASLAVQIFEYHDLLKHVGIERRVCLNFVDAMLNMYKPNPYHNFNHGFQVLHCIFLLLGDTKASGILTAHEYYATLIAGFAHDVGHPGSNNVFEINSGSNLAIRYNDESVLENFHCSLLFQVMQDPTRDMLGSMDRAERAHLRKLMVSAILSTDMAKHNAMVAQLKLTHKESETEKFIFDAHDEEKDADVFARKERMVQVVVHSCDLAHATFPWDVHRRFCENIEREFNAQVEAEEKAGMPVQEWMREKTNIQDFAKGQEGFMRYVAAPLWVTVNEVLGAEALSVNVNSNIERWAKMAKE